MSVILYQPVRIRKPNPRIFGTGEEDITKVTPRPKKQPKVTIHVSS